MARQIASGAFGSPKQLLADQSGGVPEFRKRAGRRHSGDAPRDHALTDRSSLGDARSVWDAAAHGRPDVMVFQPSVSGCPIATVKGIVGVV